jgi:copper(I)-binding protein
MRDRLDTARAQDPRNPGPDPQLASDDCPASMSPLTALEIRAGKTVRLEPGGCPITVLGLTGRFSDGDMLPVTLTFGKAAAIEMEVMVDPAGGPAMEHDDDRAMPSE